MCLKPFRFGLTEFGCGQCLPCRINRARLWTTRLMLEAGGHRSNLFVTLTYSPEHLPPGGEVVPRHLALFLKKLRKDLTPVQVRFFGVGEYGDRTFRPHYHCILFGVDDRKAVARAWGLGHVHCLDVTVELVRYICGYVVKKMTCKDDVRLGGRHPEFCRMSLKPGIGAGAAEEIARHVNTEAGAAAYAESGDVPSQVRWQRKKWPLGRYLRSKIRAASGHTMDAYDKARRARHQSLDASAWMKAFEESSVRDAKRQSAVARSRFQSSLRKGKL